MKLRIRANNLRLRLNQKEVQSLAGGKVLKEKIDFPGNTVLSYVLKTSPAGEAQIFFEDGNIQITLPHVPASNWVASDEIGFYVTLPTGGQPIRIAIEKDLECLDGREDEQDAYAFPRVLAEKVC